MTWRPRPWIGIALLTAALAGCRDENGSLSSPSAGGVEAEAGSPDALEDSGGAPGEDSKEAVLKGVIKLIRDAATNTGGDNFNIAAENLNDYFRETPASEFNVTPELRAYIAKQLPAEVLKSLEQRSFTRNDGRHIEDNLLYRAVAVRAAGEGGDLDRVGRLFDWVVRQIQLVPAGSLGAPGLFQAQARPFDVLLRGMATENEGDGWSERSWLFLTLCRQLGLDAGLIAYQPAARGPILARSGRGGLLGAGLPALEEEKEPSIFACGVLIDGRVYLFDARIGLPIPGPERRGVATLEEVIADPAILTALSLPESSYPTRAADLAGGVRVLLESSLGGLSPRMKLLQKDLAAENRMVLYRDPLEQEAAFKKALGKRCKSVDIWALPIQVEYRLFHDGQFTQATLFPLRVFDPRFPLLPARMAQLRDDPTAIQQYVSFRFAEGTLERDGKTLIAPELQHVLDHFATHFLALAQLEKGDEKQAEFLFGEDLKLLPAPHPSRPYYYMFRWGALTNLGRLAEARGRPDLAIRCYSQAQPTGQDHGNRLRARALIWRDPFVPPPGPVPPPPPSTDNQDLRQAAGM